MYTGLSAGTELTYVKGTNPYLHASGTPSGGSSSPAARRGLPGPAARLHGGRAVDREPAPARRRGRRGGHALRARRPATPPTGGRALRARCPADLDPVLGIFVAHMGPICANGLLHAAADVGRDGRPRSLGATACASDACW